MNKQEFNAHYEALCEKEAEILIDKNYLLDNFKKAAKLINSPKRKETISYENICAY